MARIIPNHPIPFNLLTECGIIDTRYQQLVECGDISQFQMALDVCPPETNLLSNGDFVNPTSAPWNLTGSWQYSASAGTLTKLAGLWSTATQITPVANGVLLKIDIDITIFTGAVLVNGGTNLFEVMPSSGTYTFWVVADTFTGIGFLGNGESEFVLNTVSVTAINTNFTVNVVDNEANVVRVINSVTAPQYFNFNNGFITFSFDWLDELGECLPDGCYRFEVSDPCDCGNGGFVASDFTTVLNQWQYSGTSWLVVAGVANFNGATSGNYCFVDNVVCDGEDYEIEYTLTNMVGNEFQVKLGVGAGVVRTTDGTYTEVITANGSLLSSVRLIGWNTAGASSFQVTDFKLTRVTRSFSFTSVWLYLMADAGCSCVVSVCNDSDGLNGGFVGTGFSPRIRLKAMYGQSKYKEENAVYEFDTGRKTRYYFRSRKVRKFAFIAPEYVHDFMRTVRGYHHQFIDGDEVFFEDSEYPDPTYKSNFNMGDITLEVSDVIELTENVALNNVIKSCAVDGGGLNILIDGGTGDGSPESTDYDEILQDG